VSFGERVVLPAAASSIALRRPYAGVAVEVKNGRCAEARLRGSSRTTMAVKKNRLHVVISE